MFGCLLVELASQLVKLLKLLKFVKLVGRAELVKVDKSVNPS